MNRGTFDLEDFLAQLQRLRKMGPLEGLLGLIPGIGKAMKEMKANISEKDIKSIEAIIQSMTRAERTKPDMINGSRRRRIAAGSGVEVSEVNKLLKMHRQMSDMMKQMRKGGRGGLAGLPPGFGGGMPQLPPGMFPGGRR